MLYKSCLDAIENITKQYKDNAYIDNMELEEIKQAIQNGKAKFGPEGMVYVTVDEDKISFTTDTMEYLMHGKLEDTMEMLFKEFGITRYEVEFHIHQGERHDKDITLHLKDIEGVQNKAEVPEIVKFILEKFYK